MDTSQTNQDNNIQQLAEDAAALIGYGGKEDKYDGRPDFINGFFVGYKADKIDKELGLMVVEKEVALYKRQAEINAISIGVYRKQNKELIKLIGDCQPLIEMLINLTPTGERRNQLCDINIQILQISLAHTLAQTEIKTLSPERVKEIIDLLSMEELDEEAIKTVLQAAKKELIEKQKEVDGEFVIKNKKDMTENNEKMFKEDDEFYGEVSPVEIIQEESIAPEYLHPIDEIATITEDSKPILETGYDPIENQAEAPIEIGAVPEDKVEEIIKTSAGEENDQPNIPIFIGCNDKDLTDRIVALADHPPFEVAIIGTQKFMDLVAEYQYQKLSAVQQQKLYDNLQSEETDDKTKKLAIEMYDVKVKNNRFNDDFERPYELFEKSGIKDFFRIHRRRDITNKEVDAVLELMVFKKYVVVTNPEDKPHRFKYQLTIDKEKHIAALELKISAIKNEILLFQGEVDSATKELDALKQKSEPTPTQDITDDNSANESGSRRDTESKLVG